MKQHVTRLVAALLILPALIILYRIFWLKYPILPTASGQTWQLFIDARAAANGDGMEVEIALPRGHPHLLIVNEEFISGAFELILRYPTPNRTGVWFTSDSMRQGSISYRATLLTRPGQTSAELAPVLKDYPASVGPEEQALARRLVDKWSQLPPTERLRAIAATLNDDWGTPAPSEAEFRAWTTLYQRHGRLTALLVLLRAADLPARSVEGIPLAESLSATPFTWIDVWTGDKWDGFSPDSGQIYKRPSSLLRLAISGFPLVRVPRGRITEVRWHLRRSIINRWDAHFERIKSSGRWLDQWSLFLLPPEFQDTFRIVLLVPIGALLVSALRNVVGFATFGTFMPVLIALAFRNTGLTYGLGIFAFIIGLGYFLRRAVDSLRLLLVPRLSLLLTAVIACLTTFALVGNRLGIQAFMAVGLLPIVILTMVIERFFIIVEEAGAKQGFETAAGSAVVAVIIFGLIQWDALQITFFVFPELIFVVAAGQVALGRYTGYRLSELIRFKELIGSS